MSAPPPLPTFDNVAPLVVSSNVDAGFVEYVFECPVTGFQATARVDLGQPVATPPPNVRRIGVGEDLAREEVDSRAENAAERVVPGATFMANIAGDLFNWRRSRRSKQAGEAAVASAPDMKQVLVTAFAQVAHEFRWDATGQRWVKASNLIRPDPAGP